MNLCKYLTLINTHLFYSQIVAPKNIEFWCCCMLYAVDVATMCTLYYEIYIINKHTCEFTIKHHNNFIILLHHNFERNSLLKDTLEFISCHIYMNKSENMFGSQIEYVRLSQWYKFPAWSLKWDMNWMPK